MGITRIRGKKNYWTNHLSIGKTAIPQIMPKNCFKMLSAALQISEVSESDSRLRIPGLCAKLSYRFQKYYRPSQYLVIDENMVAFKGRSKMKFYIPQKPKK